MSQLTEDQLMTLARAELGSFSIDVDTIKSLEFLMNDINDEFNELNSFDVMK